MINLFFQKLNYIFVENYGISFLLILLDCEITNLVFSINYYYFLNVIFVSCT